MISTSRAVRRTPRDLLRNVLTLLLDSRTIGRSLFPAGLYCSRRNFNYSSPIAVMKGSIEQFPRPLQWSIWDDYGCLQVLINVY